MRKEALPVVGRCVARVTGCCCTATPRTALTSCYSLHLPLLVFIRSRQLASSEGYFALMFMFVPADDSCYTDTTPGLSGYTRACG